MSETETGTAPPSESDRDREASQDREVVTDAAFAALLKAAPDGLAQYAWQQMSRGLPGDPSFGHIVEVARVCLAGEQYSEDDGSGWWLGSSHELCRHGWPPARS